MLEIILRIVHCFYGLVGLPANLLLIVAIVAARETGLKTYSIILFNVAVTDLICIITDLLSMTRIVTRAPWVVFIYQGACTTYGENLCFLSHDVMVHLFFHSILLIAVSFWYRNVILTGVCPSVSTVQFLLLVALSPSLILIYTFDYVHAAEDRVPGTDFLREVHSEINISEISYGVIDTFTPAGFATTLWVCVHPFVAYTIIIYYRKQVLCHLSELTGMMSEKSRIMHEALVKALTYHALLPSSLCIAVIFFHLQNWDIIRHPFLESTVFMSTTIPSVFNPLLILYFVKPYRRFFNKIFGIKERVVVKPSLSLSQTFTSSSSLSFALNVMLLIIIPLKSSKEMGLYKYLLFIFVLNDCIYTNVHFATKPVVAIRGDIYFLFSTTYPERWVISAFTMNHSHSFLLLCFHFIYRYIAVTRFELLRLFRTWWFLLFLLFCFIAESAIWFCLLFFQYETEQETFNELVPQIADEYPNLTIDGIATAHYWRHDNTLRWRPFLGSAGFCLLMTFVLCIVIFCAFNIYRLLKLSGFTKSTKVKSMQRELFYTLLVQFSVPFFLMYMPVLLVITPPLLHISFDLPFNLITSFFVVFPFLDALVILIGVRDYRMTFVRQITLVAPVPTFALGQTTTSNFQSVAPEPASLSQY